MKQKPSLKISMKSLVGVVEASSKIHLKYFRKWGPGAGDEKAAKEIVSRVDREAEDFLKTKLLKLLPGSSFYGEETGRSGKGEYLWIVDPLDGTGNYLSGLDHYSISVALARENPSAKDEPELIAGVVYKPANGEVFSAEKNQGAFHNGKRLGKARKIPLSRSLVATGTPYRSPDTAESFYACAREMVNESRDLRRFGSAA
ncbi:MAG: inositol monophosphatase, partial [Spirochaetia bacterium]|nr:inositol monophosphatase [Spirochaetia bacterium]